MQEVVYIIGVLGLTIPAVYSDWTSRRIPNWLTVPFLAAGLLYQATFNGTAGVVDALQAFALGFGTLFILWMAGSGGGGDVKFMAALSVWFGFKYTLLLLALSTLFVFLGTVGVITWSILTSGISGTKQKFMASQNQADQTTRRELQQARQQWRLMAYAPPIGIAAWLLLLLDALVFRSGQL